MQHIITLPSGYQLHYQLERRARRTAGLKVTQKGLIIYAPKHLLENQLNEIIFKKSSWILQKIASVSANKMPEMRWQHGEQLLFLGHPHTLILEHNVRSKSVEYQPGILQLAMPNHEPNLVSKKLVQWYKKQAISDFTRRLELFSTKLGVSFTSLTLSNASTRWGSCNSKKEIRLNWRLIQAPPHIINYVVCHELAHIKELNHSAQFWATVSSIYPDYKLAERALKALSPALHRF